MVVPLRVSAFKMVISAVIVLVSETLTCDIDNRPVEKQHDRDHSLCGTRARTIAIEYRQ